MVTEGNPTYHGEHGIIYKIVESLYQTSENNIMCINYTSIKIFREVMLIVGTPDRML